MKGEAKIKGEERAQPKTSLSYARSRRRRMAEAVIYFGPYTPADLQLNFSFHLCFNK